MKVVPMRYLPCLSLALLLAAAPAEAKTVVVTAAHLIDVLAGKRVDDAEVVITDGRIVSVGRRGATVPPAPSGSTLATARSSPG